MASRNLQKRESTNVSYVLAMTRIPAVASTERSRLASSTSSLADVWSFLVEEKKVSIAMQVAHLLTQLSPLTSHTVSYLAPSLDNPRQLRPKVVFEGFDFSTERTQVSNRAIFTELVRVMEQLTESQQRQRDQSWWKQYDPTIREALERTQPRFFPFKFTHGNLSLDHILVGMNEKSKVKYITGWEEGCYAPFFWEYASLAFDGDRISQSQRDANREWRRLLRVEMRRLEGYDLLQASNWVKAVAAIRMRERIRPERLEAALGFLFGGDYDYVDLLPSWFGEEEEMVREGEGGQEIRSRREQLRERFERVFGRLRRRLSR
ncbi:hypothetical protein QBC35DRAFT_478824 [Podospora australis]|uniref:Aminoglycoside phosphotransferase domain-containing protein n=1 Tax=Podospora australis TaxID=1536484 RepID=A0AAN6WIH7_9PEZI|nr:hypothetical protein QBC35DRAFT_478824 [Podospora australis]